MYDWVVCNGGHMVGILLWVLWILGRVGLPWPLAFWISGHSPFWMCAFFGLGGGLWGLKETCNVAWYNHEVLRNMHCALWVVFTWWMVHFRSLMWFAQMLLQGSNGGWTWTFPTKRQGPGGSLSFSVCTVFRRWYLLFALCNCLRVGEALHPGPHVATSWTLGIANPSGLNGKLDQVQPFAWGHLDFVGNPPFTERLDCVQKRVAYVGKPVEVHSPRCSVPAETTY